jgi:hypothetical protein
VPLLGGSLPSRHPLRDAIAADAAAGRTLLVSFHFWIPHQLIRRRDGRCVPDLRKTLFSGDYFIHIRRNYNVYLFVCVRL